MSGIVAAGDTLTIHLTAPAGDFPARLSLPFFAAVPIGTPIVSGGVQQPIPSAGPYYITEAFLDERLVLERNPNYHGPRPHNLQRIVYDLNNSTHRTLSQINSGAADYTADLREQSAFARGGSLERRFGHGADPRFHLTPQLGLQYVQLNTGRALFEDARTRRAVAYAIDRNALAGVNGGAATSQYVPPGTPGYSKASLYPLRPDLAKARRLAGGGSRSAVLYTCSNPDCGEQARVLKANLAAIGIDVAIRSFDDPYSEVFKPGAGMGSRAGQLGAGLARPVRGLRRPGLGRGLPAVMVPSGGALRPTSQLGTDGRKSAPSTEALRRVSAGREEPALT